MNDRSSQRREMTLSSICRIALMGLVIAMVLSLAMSPGADAHPAGPHPHLARIAR